MDADQSDPPTIADPSERPLRVLLAGGGTAGHVEPALALADALLRRLPDTRIEALGTASGLEAQLVVERDIPLHLMPKVTMPRTGKGVDALRSWWRVPSGLSAAVRAATRVIDAAAPNVVVGFGGYVALPAYLAARRRHVPIVVHEANARPGVANRIGARLTPHVAVSVPATVASLPHATLTGIPLRRSVATLDRPALRLAGRSFFGLNADQPTLLVFGGSQGADRLNSAMLGAAPQLLDRGIQVLHAVGPRNTVNVSAESSRSAYVTVPYIDRMDLAYAAADLVLCRSGAMTCAELAAVGLPAVLVPYPHSNGEQALNAEPLVAAGAAVMVRDEALSDLVVEHLVGGLTVDDARLAAMAKAAASLRAADADERLADLVLRAAHRS